MLLFSVKLGWLPTSGASGFKSIIMPAICAGLSNAAVLARMTRSSMVDELHADLPAYSTCKGREGENVVMKHAYRNASIPIVTTLGQALVLLLGGTVVVETVFLGPHRVSHCAVGARQRVYRW
jgi:ABC-type dipeptide/oligopeptide/nickel transport system permease component